MARIRTIKPEFPQSESMGRVSRDARLLFIMLWTIADDTGRARAASRMLASLLFPYDEDAVLRIPEWLMELERQKCIKVYAVDGNTYLQIEKWSDHQKIDKPSKSKFPAPPEKLARAREGSRNPRLGPRTKEGTKDQGPEDQDSAAPPALAPAVIMLPTNQVGVEVGISQEQIDQYAVTFPAVDVPQQFREMRQWLLDNRERRKTERGMPKFVNAWLGREQDKGSKNGNGQRQATAHENFARGLYLAAGGTDGEAA